MKSIKMTPLQAYICWKKVGDIPGLSTSFVWSLYQAWGGNKDSGWEISKKFEEELKKKEINS